MTVARNVGIILVLAAAVAFIPGGGTTAAVVAAVLSTLILVALVFFVARLYRDHRPTWRCSATAGACCSTAPSA